MSGSNYSTAYKETHKPKRGNWNDYKRCGHGVDQATITEMFRMRLQGATKKEIGQALNMHPQTVTKYLNKGTGSFRGKRCPPSVPIDAQVAEVQHAVRRVSGDTITRSITRTFNTIDKLGEHMEKLAADNKMPDQCTPLGMKQLAEAQRLILTLPQDLNRDRQDIYAQLNARDLGDADVLEDVTELAGSGGIQLIDGATDCGKTEETDE